MCKDITPANNKIMKRLKHFMHTLKWELEREREKAIRKCRAANKQLSLFPMHTRPSLFIWNVQYAILLYSPLSLFNATCAPNEENSFTKNISDSKSRFLLFE